MKIKQIFNLILTGAQGLLVIIMLISITGCGVFDSGGSNNSGGQQNNVEGNNRTVSLGTDFKNAQIVSGTQTEVKFTYTLPGSITSSEGFSVNLADTMQYVTVSSSPVAKKFNFFETLKMFAGISKAFAATTSQVTTHISSAGDPDVCISPFMVGPFDFTGDIGSQPSSGASSASTSDSGVNDIVNAGIFDICIVISPLPIDAYLTVTDVSVDLEPCDETPIADSEILGDWTGFFDCWDFGDVQGPLNDIIDLTITKNPDGSYHYEDGNAEFDGHLCGNRFKFKGESLALKYTESGTLTFNGNSATKTAIWNDTSGNGGRGQCYDELNGPT